MTEHPIDLKHKFSKAEKLKSNKVIDLLFSKGKSVYEFPIKILYLHSEASTPKIPKVLISVPKRHFKKAVDRNKIKRQIREIYRKNKNLIKESSVSLLAIGIVFTAKEKIPFELLEKKLILNLVRLKKINDNPTYK